METLSNQNNRAVGKKHEEQAAAYLESQGIVLCAHNFRNGNRGEIDLIGYDGKTLVFFEVKYRSSLSKGGALEAVGFAKQRQICRTADVYRFRNGISDNAAIRYDVVAMQQSEITWIKNAFYHIYPRNH